MMPNCKFMSLLCPKEAEKNLNDFWGRKITKISDYIFLIWKYCFNDPHLMRLKCVKTKDKENSR